MKELIGTKINQIFVNEDQSLLKFVTDKGDMIYLAEGDCCSESWFAEVIFQYKPSDFFNIEVEEVEEIEVPLFMNKLANTDGRTRQEYDEVYGYKLKSNNTCEIIFRNSSNGYYCGWCSLAENPNKHLQKLIDEAKWEEIKDDWTA